jgi:DNA processing protein
MNQMKPTLSPNSQAILLLTAPLIVGGAGPTAPLLTLGEYNRLARLLRDGNRQPADLIGPGAEEVLALCDSVVERPRLEELLGRGFLLAQAVDRWATRAIWVVSRADQAYPQRLKGRLKENAPPILYGCGSEALLHNGGIAIVGSRHVDDVSLAYTFNVGLLAAHAKCTVISGGARGIDSAAMDGALQNGGSVIGVLAERLEQVSIARHCREALLSQRLVLVSPYDPSSSFNVGHAMQRNKLIYALADAALVVNSDLEHGGTWAGAIEQLQRFRLVPVFVRNGTNASDGNLALLRHGAHPWPDPSTPDGLGSVLAAANALPTERTRQVTLPFRSGNNDNDARQADTSKPENPPSGSQVAKDSTISAAELIFKVVRDVLQTELSRPRTESELAGILEVSKAQVKVWLKKLVDLNEVEKLSRPARYRLSTSHGREGLYK